MLEHSSVRPEAGVVVAFANDHGTLVHARGLGLGGPHELLVVLADGVEPGKRAVAEVDQLLAHVFALLLILFELYVVSAGAFKRSRFA